MFSHIFAGFENFSFCACRSRHSMLTRRRHQYLQTLQQLRELKMSVKTLLVSEASNHSIFAHHLCNLVIYSVDMFDRLQRVSRAVFMGNVECYWMWYFWMAVIGAVTDEGMKHFMHCVESDTACRWPGKHMGSYVGIIPVAVSLQQVVSQRLCVPDICHLQTCSNFKRKNYNISAFKSSFHLRARELLTGVYLV